MTKSAAFSRHTLSNGLRVVLVPQKHSPTTTCMVFVGAGSKYETKKLGGISHFLEHMCFKGTEKRPIAMDIASELDGMGAGYNAFTGHEVTAYYARVKNDFAEHALEVVADIYANPRFQEAEIEKEKGVIVEEINMYEDLPQRKVQELFLECVYGDQPAGRPIAGTKETVRSFIKSDFVRYRKVHYVPQSTVAVVVGGFEHKSIFSFLKTCFADLEKGPKSEKRKVRDSQRVPGLLVRHRKSDQTHLMLGFRAFPLSDPRRYALKVLVDILGGGMSSRLFHRIREEMGAAYYVRAMDDLYLDHGLVQMAAGVRHDKAREVVRAGLQEFARLKDEPVSAKELAKAKDHVVGTSSLSLETSEELALFYGMREALGLRPVTPEQIFRQVRAVTATDIRTLARQLFQVNRLNLACIGPFREGSFRKLLTI